MRIAAVRRSGDDLRRFCPSADGTDIEPSWKLTLDDRLRTRGDPPYTRATLAEVAANLDSFLADRLPGAKVDDLRRLGGGGSKEQFVFQAAVDGERRRYVLRMDPKEGVVATSREREMEALVVLAPTVPVPEPVWLDGDGSHFGRPAMIVGFCEGVTKPSASAANIVGVGSTMGEDWRRRLGRPFVDQLAAIHNVPWQAAAMEHIGVPDADPRQAARWQVNAWARVWEEDKVASLPMMTVAHRWMIERLPPVDRMAFVNCDYRSGYFLFVDSDCRITAFFYL